MSQRQLNFEPVRQTPRANRVRINYAHLHNNGREDLPIENSTPRTLRQQSIQLEDRGQNNDEEEDVEMADGTPGGTNDDDGEEASLLGEGTPTRVNNLPTLSHTENAGSSERSRNHEKRLHGPSSITI